VPGTLGSRRPSRPLKPWHEPIGPEHCNTHVEQQQSRAAGKSSRLGEARTRQRRKGPADSPKGSIPGTSCLEPWGSRRAFAPAEAVAQAHWPRALQHPRRAATVAGCREKLEARRSTDTSAPEGVQLILRRGSFPGTPSLERLESRRAIAPAESAATTRRLRPLAKPSLQQQSRAVGKSQRLGEARTRQRRKGSS
jgi:hypothetical protein